MRTLDFGGGKCVWTNANGLLITRLSGLITSDAQRHFAREIARHGDFHVIVGDHRRAVVLSDDAMGPYVPLDVVVAHVLSAAQLQQFCTISQARIQAGGVTRNFTDVSLACAWAQRRLADLAPRWAHESAPAPL